MDATPAIEEHMTAAGIPACLQEPVRHWVHRYEDAGGRMPPGQTAGILLRLVAASPYAASVLLRDTDWFTDALATGALAGPPEAAGSGGPLDPANDTDVLKRMLRRHRNRRMVHILWRQAAGHDDVWATIAALSALAESLIRTSMAHAGPQLGARFGVPRTKAGEAVAPVILAMGKLGGGELNFSSDIDLVFLYTAEGDTDGPRSLSAHEYFTRYARQVVALLDETTADGFVYRVDTRLRPFGDSGPPVISIGAFENYLLQHGRSWERYAYIKAKVIAPDADALSIRELENDIIAPFVYRRYLDYGVLESLRDMKSLIESEVRSKELQDDIKLGPGGIREIEFIAQSLQLVRGGSDRPLRTRSLRTALSRLGHVRGLGAETAAALLEAYGFLREFENAGQAIRDQQTHRIPADAADRARLALAMGRPDWPHLADELAQYREIVSRSFAGVAFRADDERSERGEEHAAAVCWSLSRSEDEWAASLRDAGYEEPDNLARELRRFAKASLQRQIDVTARKRLDRCMDTLLGLLVDRAEPATVCARVVSVLSGIVRRSAYVALLNENPLVLERLTDLCEQSAYLAAELARFPLLLDELLDPRIFSAGLSAAEMKSELSGRLDRVDSLDSEGRIETLAQFQRATLFRIAVADISGDLPIMKVSDALTDLAELVLRQALEVAWQDLAAKHGAPRYELDGQRRAAGFGVVGYGKLGGIELSYGSDLDIVFLHDSTGARQETDGAKPLDNAMFFSRLVRRLVHFLTTQTSSGVLYEVDTRLRPSGRSGLLVVSLEGFEKYQEENAWTWEHQALLRSRPVAGSDAVAAGFRRIRTETLRFRVRRDRLLDDVLTMRRKMRETLDKSSADRFDLKHGEGGIGDIEFLVQYLVLKHAADMPSLVAYSDNIRQLDALRDNGILAAEVVRRMQAAYKSFRLKSHRLALDGRAAHIDAADFEAERVFVRETWTTEMK